MQDRYIKDLAILLCVIVVIVLCFRVYYVYNRIHKIPKESPWSTLALDDELLAKIQQIDESISERKEFRFRVTRDPLKQDLIVQTRLDLLAEWEAMVKRTMRLSSMIEDNQGNRLALVEYEGKSNMIKVGDTLGNRRFTSLDFTNRRLYYTENGITQYMVESKVPPKPVQLESRSAAATSYNW